MYESVGYTTDQAIAALIALGRGMGKTQASTERCALEMERLCVVYENLADVKKCRGIRQIRCL